jgi:hypothetical protein
MLEIVDLSGEDPPTYVEELSHQRIREAVVDGAVRTPTFHDTLLPKDTKLL